MTTIESLDLASITGGTMLPREPPEATMAPGRFAEAMKPLEPIKSNLGELIRTGGHDWYPTGGE